MKLRLKKIISFVLAIIIINTVVSTSAKADTSNKIVVEVLYNVNGQDFADNIIFDDGTKLSDYDYVVKYDETKLSDYAVNSVTTYGYYPIGDYFNYAAWITRDGVVSLALDPTHGVRGTTSIKDAAWSVLASPTHGFGSSPNWRNTQVMQWQFDCHFAYAKDNAYWNLEPHRTASSYFQVVAASCNP